jgi:hypothetical protein
MNVRYALVTTKAITSTPPALKWSGRAPACLAPADQQPARVATDDEPVLTRVWRWLAAGSEHLGML